MTAAEVHPPAPASASPRGIGPTVAGARLARLHLISRRVPVALGLLAGIGALLWAVLHWHWNIAGGPAAQQFVPLTVEAGAAAIVGVATYGPFGELERATGRWLPWLRLGAVLLLTAAAFGALAAGATGGALPGGDPTLLRNLGGMIGIGLLVAVLVGGAFAWAGPMAFMLITEGALAGRWTTPWDWPARPPHDVGAAWCAGLVFSAGVVAVTVWGSRARTGD